MAESAVWLVGHAREDITPAPPFDGIYLAGYDSRPVEGVRDPLEAHALALACGGAGVVLVALDLLGVFHGDAAEIRCRVAARLGSAAPSVVVCCTHTHAAPDLLGLWGPNPGVSGMHPGYRVRVVQAATRAAVAAWRGRGPARLQAAEAPVEGVAENSRDPEVLDPLLTVLSWDDPVTGAPRVRVIHFACHPETLGPTDRRISADLAGQTRRLLASASACPCIWWQGALGGMVGPATRAGECGEQALLRLGNTLGAATVRLATALEPAPGGLLLRREDVLLPLDNPAFVQAAEGGVLRRATVPGPDGVPAVRSSAGWLRLGPHLWQLAPGEVLPGLTRRWSARYGALAPNRRLRLLGLCDDEVGYILPEDAFTPGRYEERTSLGPRTAATLEEAYDRLLDVATP